ncbi:hypothetical protein BKD03_17235 [Brucella sp. 09RB8471]|nr:hypothetical protein BKD03_06055 [Brucella sp. 09RB8471]APX70841.1 hypothetical protein BKD03_17235 [Brucella sp. 09RB8471]
MLPAPMVCRLSPKAAFTSSSATGVHAIQLLDAQHADCRRVPEPASPRSHPRIFGRNFREPHRIKGNRALPPWPLPFLLHGNALRSRLSIQDVSVGRG